MNKRTAPMAILGCILALAGLAGYLAPEPTEAVPSRLLMENAGGRVVFTHAAHTTSGDPYNAGPCSTCHHELLVASADEQNAAIPNVLACSACHGSAEDPEFSRQHQEPYRAKEGQQTCARCHHISVEGYSDKWNHKDHHDYVGDCATCHHERAFEFKPGRIMNVQPQKCSNCHTRTPNPMTATTIKDAGHQRCEPCHSDLFTSGNKNCAACHGRTLAAQALESGKGTLDAKFLVACSRCHAPIAGTMDALHANCMGCHDKAGKGPGKEAPCAQCHTP